MTIWVVSGCGGPPPVDSSDTEATVKGTVTIDGKPATEGEVSFDPSNNKRPTAGARSAPIGKDGTYSIKTLTGENEVRLGGALVQKHKVLGFKRFSTNVQSGENKYDISATSE